MKKRVQKIFILGALCLAAVMASSVYAVLFNDSRLVAPMDFSEYAFTARDLPMLASMLLLAAYVLYLFVLLLRAIFARRKEEPRARVTRRLNPRWGYLGLFGFLGCLGFWSYPAFGQISPFCFFLFFGFFGFFYEGRLSNTLMDERYRENRTRAALAAGRVSHAVIFLAVLVVGLRKSLLSTELALIAFLIAVTLALALELFLSEYLLYRYDHGGQAEADEE